MLRHALFRCRAALTLREPPYARRDAAISILRRWRLFSLRYFRQRYCCCCRYDECAARYAACLLKRHATFFLLPLLRCYFRCYVSRHASALIRACHARCRAAALRRRCEALMPSASHVIGVAAAAAARAPFAMPAAVFRARLSDYRSRRHAALILSAACSRERRRRRHDTITCCFVSAARLLLLFRWSAMPFSLRHMLRRISSRDAIACRLRPHLPPPPPRCAMSRFTATPPSLTPA